MDNSIVRRLEIEFDNEVVVLEEGEVEEYSESELDIVIVSHILSKCETGEFDCPICYESTSRTKRVTISCNHDFCMPCTKSLLESCDEQQKNVTCPMCRYPCFLLETPDVAQFAELSDLVDNIQGREQVDMAAFLYHHFVIQ